MDFQLTREDYVCHPRSRVLGGLKKDISAGFLQEVSYLEETFAESVRNAHLEPLVQVPDIALARMRAALPHLNLPDIYYRDCMEGVETLRRNTREVLAFILWARPPPFSPLQFAVRGSIAPNADTYVALASRHVPVWLVARHPDPSPRTFVFRRPLDEMCALQSWRQVPTADRTDIDSEQTYSGEYRLLHTKALWYYPPIVNGHANFERAARGYATRIDTYNPDKRNNRDLFLLRRAGKDIAALRASHC